MFLTDKNLLQKRSFRFDDQHYKRSGFVPDCSSIRKDFELAFTHLERSGGEEYYTFVNGQHTIHGGTHQQALREAIVKTVRDFYKKIMMQMIFVNLLRCNEHTNSRAYV